MPLELMDLWRNMLASGSELGDRERAASLDEIQSTQPKTPLEVLTRKDAPGPLETVKTAVGSPENIGKTLKGGTWDKLVGIGEALKMSAARAVQAFSPTPIEAAKDPYFTPDTTQGLQLAKRAGALSNALTLGMPDIFNMSAEKVAREREGRPPETWDEKLWHVAKTIYGAADEMLIRPERELLRGQKDSGKPLTPEEIGSNVFDIATMVIPTARGAGRLVGDVTGPAARLLPFKAYTKKTISSGELANIGRESEAGAVAADTAVNAEKAAAPKATTGEASAVDEAVSARQALIDNLTPEEKARYQLIGALDHQPIREIGASVARTKIFEDVVAESALKKDAAPINELIGRAIDSGALDELGEGAVAIAQKYGIPLESASKELGTIFRSSAQQSGKGLKAFRDISELVEGELLQRANKGDVDAIDALRRLGQDRKTDITWDQAKRSWPLIGRWLQQGVRTEEQFRRSMMVGQVMTSMRNAAMQGVTFFPVAGLEAAMTDLTNMLVNPSGPKWLETKAYGNTLKSMAVQAGENIGDALGRVGGANKYDTPLRDLWESFNVIDLQNAGVRQKLSEVLDELPFTRSRLLGPASTEASMYTMKGFNRAVKKADSVRDYSEIASGIVTSLNNFQEKVYRNIFFRTRLESNIARHYKTSAEDMFAGKHWDQLKSDLKDLPELPQPLKEGIADAEEYALKQTMAFTPAEGRVKWALDVYQQAPELFVLTGIPFPRYLYNNISWHVERSPHNFLNLFSPEFRSKLFDAEGNLLETTNAARTIGRALSGVTQIGAAMALRNSEWAGPKYYELYTDPNKKDKVIDLRSESPYVDWALIGDLFNHIAKGVPMNLSAKEWFDGVANMRLADMPPLQFLDDIRNMDVTKPEDWQKMVGSMFGRHIGSYFNFGNSIREVAGAASEAITGEPSKLLTRGDIKGSELLGPTQVALGNVGLPVQYSGWTGEPIYQETPLKHQGAGLSIIPKTRLQALSDSTPGITAQSIFGDYKFAELNNRVKNRMGELFQLKGENGKSLGDTFTDLVERIKPVPEFQRFLLSHFFNEVKHEAESRVEADLATDPKLARLFLEVKLRQTNELPSPIIRDMVKKLYSNGTIDASALAAALIEQKKQYEAQDTDASDEVK